MTMDYKPNSHKYKNEMRAANDKKVEKVVKGKVKVKKKNEIQKLAGSIISEDAKNVKSYILMDVLLPAIKDAIEDIVTNGVHMLLRGESSSRRSSSGVSKISYNKVYTSRDRYDSPVRHRTLAGYDFGTITFDYKEDAEDVLHTLDEILDEYHFVSVADLYYAIGEDANYTDDNFGWTSLRSAEIVRTRDGYSIRFPKVRPID